MKISRLYQDDKPTMHYVECDECGEMFSLNLKERNLPAGGKWAKERYFVCPVCKHKYICARWDKNGVLEGVWETLDNFEQEGVKAKE